MRFGAFALLILAAAARLALLSAGAARAAENDAAPGIVDALGTKFDKSFNEGAWRRAERFKKKTGVAYLEIGIAGYNQRRRAFSRLTREGAALAGVGCCVAMHERYEFAAKHPYLRRCVDRPGLGGGVCLVAVGCWGKRCRNLSTR
jgi:basic membrane lipoprotein Med (substrate-binding protein (PBP1-ABC) superfamily)